MARAFAALVFIAVALLPIRSDPITRETTQSSSVTLHGHEPICGLSFGPPPSSSSAPTGVYVRVLCVCVAHARVHACVRVGWCSRNTYDNICCELDDLGIEHMETLYSIRCEFGNRGFAILSITCELLSQL